jgi:hypothetical protein
MKTHNVGWKVSLSNGETFYEGKGAYEVQKGTPSPWHRLQDHIKSNDLKITSLSLYSKEGMNWHVHSPGNSPRFQEFEKEPKPVELRIFRAMTSGGGGINGAYVETHFTVAQAKYPDYILQMWVSETDPKNCWAITLPASESVM